MLFLSLILLRVSFFSIKPCSYQITCSKLVLPLLSNATVGAPIRNVGPSESMIRLSFNMAAASHTWFRNEEF